MFDPLNLANQQRHTLQLRIDHIHEHFICLHMDNIKHTNAATIARYHLQNMDNLQTYILEVTKDKALNFHIHCYQLLEQKPYNHAFISILGTESIGYQLKTEEQPQFTIYHRILHKNENLNIYKYIADADDFDRSPEYYGYNQDANGNWYLLMQKSDGIVKNFTHNQPKRSWEYKQTDDQRLLIELEESGQKKEKYFDIFHGKRLKRKDIKLVPWAEKNNHNILQELLRGESAAPTY